MAKIEGGFAPFPVTPGGPRGIPPSGASEEFVREIGYAIEVYRSDTKGDGSFDRVHEQKFQSGGDHLTVLRINGPDKLAVQVGSSTSEFFPIREGMVIARPFDTFKVRLHGRRLDTIPFQGPTQAIFVASYGAMFERLGEPRRGFHPGAFTVTQIVNNAGIDLLSPASLRAFFGQAAGAPFGVPSLLRYGGTLRVHNRSQTVPVFLWWGQATAPTVPPYAVGRTIDEYCWQIDPGAKEEFDFESDLLWNQKIDPTMIAGGTWSMTLYGFTLADTAPLALLFSSPAEDTTDPDTGMRNITVDFRPDPIGGGA